VPGTWLFLRVSARTRTARRAGRSHKLKYAGWLITSARDCASGRRQLCQRGDPPSVVVQLRPSVLYASASALHRVDGREQTAPQPVAFYAAVFFLVNATCICLIWELIDHEVVSASARRIMHIRSVTTLCLIWLAAIVALKYPLVGLGICICCLILYLKTTRGPKIDILGMRRHAERVSMSPPDPQETCARYATLHLCIRVPPSTLSGAEKANIRDAGYRLALTGPVAIPVPGVQQSLPDETPPEHRKRAHKEPGGRSW
jgi:hypothetical protein